MGFRRTPFSFSEPLSLSLSAAGAGAVAVCACAVSICLRQSCNRAATDALAATELQQSCTACAVSTCLVCLSSLSGPLTFVCVCRRLLFRGILQLLDAKVVTLHATTILRTPLILMSRTSKRLVYTYLLACTRIQV